MKNLFALLLLVLLPLAAYADNAAAAPVEGEDYVLIDGGQPWRPLDGKVEVVEVFGYWCPHCAAFQPALSAWERKLPPQVRFTYVPAVFSSGVDFARAYFAAEAAGALPRTHEAMYRAVHVDGLLAHNATVDELAAYYATQGLDAAKMKAAMLSPATEAKLQAARAFALRSGVEGTPTLVINGRYRVLGHSTEEVLRIAGQLVEQLRRRR